MKRNKLRRTLNDLVISQVGDEVADENLDVTGSLKASADYYERLARYRAEFRMEEIWIVIGLYLILAGVAFVIL